MCLSIQRDAALKCSWRYTTWRGLYRRFTVRPGSVRPKEGVPYTSRLINGWKWFHFRQDNADWIWRWGRARTCGVRVSGRWFMTFRWRLRHRASLAAILSARLRVSRARPFVLIDLHRHPRVPAGPPPPPSSGRPRPRRELWPRPIHGRVFVAGARARNRQLAVSERTGSVTGSEQSPTNKTNGVDWITGALPRQMTPRSWFMAFHVDLPTVPGITLDRPPTFVCRSRGRINTFASRVTWSSVITPRRFWPQHCSNYDTTNTTQRRRRRRRCCCCKTNRDVSRTITISWLFSIEAFTGLYGT